MYESHKHPPLPRPHFLQRMLFHGIIAIGLMVTSLFIGMAGYVYYESLAWHDAFVNAAMLLGGMGPLANPQTTGGKLFAGFYALYAGLVFLVAAGVVLAPVVHRLLHKFHWDAEKGS